MSETMDKRAQGKIAELLYFDFEDYARGTIAEMTWRDAPQARRDTWLNKASKVLGVLGELGYRKLPKDKPLLLSDEERRQIPKGFHYLLEYKEELDWLLKAQQEADIKFYEDI